MRHDSAARRSGSAARGKILVRAAYRDENDHEVFIYVDPARFQRNVRDYFEC
jgi:hypothetical protein